MMTKRDFISLADAIKGVDWADRFTDAQLVALADWCEGRGLRFDRQGWFRFVRGLAGLNEIKRWRTKGPGGGKRKPRTKGKVT